MAVGDAYVFPGFLTPVLTQLFFSKPLTTFLTCFCRGERRKYAGKKSRCNPGSNSQPPGHESDTLTTEQPGRGSPGIKIGPTLGVKLERRNKESRLQNSSPLNWRTALTFGVKHLLADLYHVCSYDARGVKTGPALGVTSWNIETKKTN